MTEERRFIRLRGLPWSVSNQEILDFLEGVNVVDGENGVHLVTSRFDGKQTGEAFVELESEQDEEEAFKHNKENLGHRYIEIFTATSEEAEFAMRKPGTSNVVKLRGLPYSIDEATIEDFFNGLAIKSDREGIVIVTDRRGRASGEAYVQFDTQEDTENALKLNREKIGHRYIEIFRSSIGELKRASNSNRPGPYDRSGRGGPRGGGGDNDGRGSGSGFGRNNRSRGGDNFGGRSGGFNNGGRSNNFNNGGGFGGGGGGGGGNNRFNNNGFDNFNNFNNNRNNNFDDDDNDNFGGNGGFSNRNNNFGNNFGGNNFGSNGGGGGGDGGRRNNSEDDDLYCVHLRGLPYYCYEDDVKDFLAPLAPSKVKINYNNKGLHSGTADAYFENEDDAEEAMKKDRDQMGSRYIELFFDGKKGGNFRRI